MHGSGLEILERSIVRHFFSFASHSGTFETSLDYQPKETSMQFLIMVIAMLFSGGVVAEEFFAEEDVVRLVPMAVEEPHPCDRYTLYWT